MTARARQPLRAHPGIDPRQLPALIDRLYRAAWAITGSPHDAEDLVQETFVRVLAGPRTLRHRTPAPYLLQTLRNTHVNNLRTAGRRPRTTALPGEESLTLESRLAQPQVELEHRETLETIATLAPAFRDALVAVDIVGLSYREAATALNTREATIATRLFRGRQTVATALGATTCATTSSTAA